MYIAAMQLFPIKLNFSFIKNADVKVCDTQRLCIILSSWFLEHLAFLTLHKAVGTRSSTLVYETPVNTTGYLVSFTGTYLHCLSEPNGKYACEFHGHLSRVGEVNLCLVENSCRFRTYEPGLCFMLLEGLRSRR